MPSGTHLVVHLFRAFCVLLHTVLYVGTHIINKTKLSPFITSYSTQNKWKWEHVGAHNQTVSEVSLSFNVAGFKASMDAIRILFLSLLSVFSFSFCASWASFLHLVAFEFEGIHCRGLSKLHGRDKVSLRIITVYVPELDEMYINKATLQEMEIF